MITKEIKQAFANVLREDGTTLHEALAMDDRLSDLEILKARKKDCDEHWQELALKDLSDKESALSFLDEKGFLYYLPAFMLAAIEGHVDYSFLFFHLTRLPNLSLRKSTPEKFVAKYAFDYKQVKAIAMFLCFAVASDFFMICDPAEMEAVKRWGIYMTTNQESNKSMKEIS